MVSQTISHYRIIRKLGAGGMGEVYLAEDMNLGRKVALKVLPETFTRNEDRLRRFVQEAKAASALNHPNLITIHEIGQCDALHFIATEFIQGETLRRHLHRSMMNVSEALDIAIQVASALTAAHRAGVIHRDIKPENVMLREDRIAKVLDFGLAKLSEQQATSANTSAPTVAKLDTEPGLLLGTLDYMSPEQARGKEVDTRTDIFSFGVLLYEMVTGRAPFAAETTGDIIAAILMKEPEPITRYSPHAPAELQRVISKTLRKDREERYQTMKELLVDLKSLKQELDYEAKSRRGNSPRPTGGAAPPAEGGATAATGAEMARPSQQADGRIPSAAERIVGEIGQHKKGGVAVIVLLLAFVVGYLLLRPSAPNDSGAPSPKAIRSLAVLPFANASTDANDEFLSDGISESLINSLSQLAQLKVIARTTAFRYKGRDVDPQAIGRELKVDAVLTGKLIQQGDALSVQADLVSTADGSQLWGERYNRKSSDLLSVQDEMARQISETLRLRLTGEERQSLVKRYTDDTVAYQLYLKGRFYWNKRTDEGIRKSVEYFQQAIEKDPSYALAYAGLADAYSVMPSFSDGLPDLFFPKSKAAARRALEFDESLAEAHTALARVLFAYDWNFTESDREYQRAIELNPNYATAHHWYGNANLLRTGRFDESIVEMKRALELDPLSLIINADLGENYYLARRYDEAIEQLRNTIEMDQRFQNAHYKLGVAYQLKGLYQDAIAEYKRAGAETQMMLAHLGQVYAASGNTAEALKSLARLNELSRHHYVPPYRFAIIYVALGKKDIAFQWLEKSYQDHGQEMTRLKVDPFLEPLRSDRRFQDLMRRVGLPQ